jgi:hypothetical protein
MKVSNALRMLAFAGSIAAVSAPGCSQPLTGVVLTVVTDMPVSQLKSFNLTVSASAGKGASGTTLDYPLSGPGKSELPGTFAIYADDPVTVTIVVTGNQDDPQNRVVRTARLTLVQGELLSLQVALEQVCVKVDCNSVHAGYTCVDGTCESPDVNAGSLTPFDPNDPQGMVQCGSFIDTSTGKHLTGAGCKNNQTCREGRCLDLNPHRDGGPTDVGEVTDATTGTDGGDAGPTCPASLQTCSGPGQGCSGECRLGCCYPGGCTRCVANSCGSGMVCSQQGCCAPAPVCATSSPCSTSSDCPSGQQCGGDSCCFTPQPPPDGGPGDGGPGTDGPADMPIGPDRPEGGPDLPQGMDSVSMDLPQGPDAPPLDIPQNDGPPPVDVTNPCGTTGGTIHNTLPMDMITRCPG